MSAKQILTMIENRADHLEFSWPSYLKVSISDRLAAYAQDFFLSPFQCEDF